MVIPLVHCLVSNSLDITSTLLWDSNVQDYVGILSISDFIEVLLHLHNSPITSDLDQQKIRDWRGMLSLHLHVSNSYYVFVINANVSERTGRNRKLISIHPEGDMFTAMKQLVAHRIHRLPIVHQSERNDVLYIITHSSILWDIINNVCRVYCECAVYCGSSVKSWDCSDILWKKWELEHLVEL